MARKPIKFFPLTDELRDLLKLIQSIGGDYPHQSLINLTLKSGHYHPKDREWLNKVREYYINTSIKKLN